VNIAIASDHAGFKLKEFLSSKLSNVTDLGTDSEQSVDYPDSAKIMAEHLKANPNTMGILICGSGIGITMAANRFNHVRAALCRDADDAKMSRLHNDANVLVLGGRVTDQSIALEMTRIFLDTKFEGGRHENRINKMSN
jgi:ribose 5-phosphate isomerase B